MERPADRQRLSTPEQTLGQLSDFVVIDEVQRSPELFEVLRVHIDRPGTETSYLLLGSASPTLIRGVSESLAGRVGLVDLNGFNLEEVSPDNWRALWLRGGFPRSYLAKIDAASATWREGFIRIFLERDLPQLGIAVPPETLRRFWTMLAHCHGQIWNGAEFARALGSSEPTARRYLDILAGAFMVRFLPPWHEDLKKRQVKSPKIYVRDSGLLHGLLELKSHNDLKLGASWEGFAMEQILSIAPTRSAYFWATHAGAELDPMLTIKGKRYGFESSTAMPHARRDQCARPKRIFNSNIYGSSIRARTPIRWMRHSPFYPSPKRRNCSRVCKVAPSPLKNSRARACTATPCRSLMPSSSSRKWSF